MLYRLTSIKNGGGARLNSYFLDNMSLSVFFLLWLIYQLRAADLISEVFSLWVKVDKNRT